MESYSFRDCTLTLLDRRFGLRQVFSNSVLDQWLQTDIQLDESEKSSLHSLQTLLRLNVQGWNEFELSMNFIGPIFSLVGFTELYRFNLFAQRHIGTVVKGIDDDIELSGAPDGIIATGYREPEVPMFAFSEYKRQLDPTGDPAGQALAAMLVGQTLNQNDGPIYGAYVIGSDWRFMVLDRQQYAISEDFSAIRDDLFDILCILKALKQIILEATAK